MQLDSGMIDAVACDLSIAQYQIAANPDKYVQLSTPLSTEHYAVGFKKGDTELAQKVSETLKQLDADGTVKQLCEKYASYGVSYDNWSARPWHPSLALRQNERWRILLGAEMRTACPMRCGANQQRSCMAGESLPRPSGCFRQPAKVGIRRVKTRAFLLEGDQWNSEP